MRDSVPSVSYSRICNVLRLWRIWLIPTYRVYRLYDSVEFNYFSSAFYALDKCHNLWSARDFGLVTTASRYCVCVRVCVCVCACVCAWCYCTFSVQYLYSECVC